MYPIGCADGKRLSENEENNMYDLIITGAGPAGLAAAIYAARAELNFIVLEKTVHRVNVEDIVIFGKL